MKFAIRSIRRRKSLRSGVVDIGHELARQGKWFAWVNQETGQGRRLRFYVAWRPLAVLAVGLMLAGYLMAAAALAWWLDRRPYNLVGFQDVVLPWRWAEVNALRGEGFAQNGIAELEAESISRGIFFLQRGLSLKPDNEAARMALGRLYANGNYYDGVRRTLAPQLEFRFSRPVAELLFQQAQRADDYRLIVEIAGNLRATVEPNSGDETWLVGQQVSTLLANQKPEAALALLREVDPDIYLLKGRRVQGLIANDKLEEALSVARSIEPALPGMEPVSLKLQALVRSDQRDSGALLALVEEIRDLNPLSRGSWLFGIEGLAAAEMNDEAEIWIGDYLTRFAAQQGALEQLIVRVAAADNPNVLRHAMRRIGEWQQLNPNQRMTLALVLIRAGDWSALAEDFADLLAADLSTEPMVEWLQAVMAAVRPNNPPRLLEALLSKAPPQLIVCQSMAQGFATAERWDLVKLVVDAGMRVHRHSARLQKWDEQTREHLGDGVADTRARDMVAATGFGFTADDVPRIRLELRRGVEAERWAEVETTVRQIRRERPAWIGQIAAILDWSEAHVAAAQSDYDRLRLLAPAVLSRDGEMAAWFTDQAETAVAAGRSDSAVRLLEVILVEEKFYHRARALLKELTAVPEPATEAPTRSG